MIGNIEKPKFEDLGSSLDNIFTREVAQEFPKSNDISDLPDSFEDAVERAALRTMDIVNTGKMRVRIDFDTSIGDMTFTSLKNTMPMLKAICAVYSRELGLDDVIATEQEPEREGDIENTMGTNTGLLGDDNDTSMEEENVPASTPGLLSKREIKLMNSRTRDDVKEQQKVNQFGLSEKGSIRIFFPDMGAAVLARRDWKLGAPDSEVPNCVVTNNIQNDRVQATDKLVILVCPLYSETDFVKKIIDQSEAVNVPLVMINPDLVNGDQGFGVRARNLRKEVIDTFVTAYKLKTLAEGAIVREWPRGYSIWNEDAEEEIGYRHLGSFISNPPRELMYDIFDEANPVPTKDGKKQGPSAVESVFKEVTGFFSGLSKL